MLIEILILFFIVLLFYQTYIFYIDNYSSLFKEDNIKEGYTDYEQTSYMLSQKNAVNIQDLKERIDNISNINNNYDELNNRLSIVEEKIDNLISTNINNTKGTDFDTNIEYNFDDEEEDEDKKNGLPDTVDPNQFSTEKTGDIPSMDNLDLNNNIM